MSLRRIAIVLALSACARQADWPVYQGSDAHDHYVTLSQITPENVSKLQVAWTYDTRDAFPGSEMQSNPVIVDGVLYAMSPKQRAFALDAATGKELWSFDPTGGSFTGPRIRYRGVVVHGGRVYFNYRHRLFALDAKTGRQASGWGNDSGWVDLRAGLGRPVEGLSVSASTPGVVYRDMLIVGTSVPEALPSAPGDIRAYDVKTGAIRWTFHTIPHPGEFGYETWPPDAWKVAGGANAWSGVTVDQKRGMVFFATGSASYDFYGVNRVGDDLFANSIVALDANTGKRIWHFQGLKHDLWDRDFPAAPALVTVTRDGKAVDAIAQTTKTGHVWVLDRMTGKELFPSEWRRMPKGILPGEVTADSQRFPTLPKPFVRQRLTEADLTDRTPEAHAAALAVFRDNPTPDPFTPPNERGIIIFPGVDGGGEYGGPAFDPETGLLYVNGNEMGWVLKIVPRETKSLFGAYCAECHGPATTPLAPTLTGVAKRLSPAQIVDAIRSGTGRMPAFATALGDSGVAQLADYLVSGKQPTIMPTNIPTFLKYRNASFDIFLDPEGYPAIKPPWGTLTALDLNTGETKWAIPLGEYPKLAAQGLRLRGRTTTAGRWSPGTGS